MTNQSPCPRCGSRVPLVTNEGRSQCPDCGSEFAVAMDPSSQWFVTLPDGRQIGPVSAQQMHEASQAGKITGEALVRRGDWSEAIPHAKFIAQQSQASSSRPTEPSYGKQVISNPLGTYFFGPKLADYQSQQGAELAALRKRHFRRWVYLLLGMVLAAVLLPLIGGLIRGNAEVAIGGALFGLFIFFWPTIFFLLGMLMYAGAWFEWSWFFRSRTLRHARGMFGDGGARKFYLIFGGVLMIGGAFVSIVGSLVIGGSLAFVPDRQVAAANNRVRAAEQNVDQAWQLLESNAKPLRDQLDRIDALQASIAQRPNDLKLREQLVNAQRRLPKLYSDYRLFRDQWQKSVTRLGERAKENGNENRVQQANREIPAEFDFTEQILVTEEDQFPVAEVKVATGRLMGIRRSVEQLQAAPGNASPATIERITSDLEQQRTYLQGIEAKFGFHSPGLDGLATPDDLKALAAKSQEARPVTPPVAVVPPPQVEGPGNNAPPQRPPGIPLLARFDAQRQTLRGKVSLANDSRRPALITQAMEEHALAYLDPPIPFPRYEIEAEVTRIEGDGGLFLVLMLQGKPAALVIDGGDPNEPRTGLVALDQQVLTSPRYPAELLEGTQFGQDEKVHLLCSVVGNRLSLQLDGEEVYTWEGQVSRISLPPFYQSNQRHKLHLGSFHSRFRLETISLHIR